MRQFQPDVVNKILRKQFVALCFPVHNLEPRQTNPGMIDSKGKDVVGAIVGEF